MRGPAARSGDSSAARTGALLALLAACPSSGSDPVDATPPPIDAADRDAAPVDAAIDAAPDAAMIPCVDLDVGPTATFDELVESPRQGDQTDILMSWGGAFAQLVWNDAEGVMTIRNSVTATYLPPVRRIGGGTATAIACQETSECMIALRDPLGLVRVDGMSVLVDANPIVDPAFREVAAIGARAGQYLVVYRDATTGGWRVQRYRTIGQQPLDAVPRDLPPLTGAKPVVAGCDASGCLIAYPGTTGESGRFRVPWVGAVGALAPSPGAWDRVACHQTACLWGADGAGWITDTAGGNAQPVVLPPGKLAGLAATMDSFQLVIQSTVVPTEWSAHRVSAAGQVTAQGMLPGARWVDAKLGCYTATCTVFAREPSAHEPGEHDVGIARMENTVLETELKYVPGANAQTDTLVATSGTIQVVAWIDHRGDGVRWRFARRDATGLWLDTESTELPVAGAALPLEASLTWTGHDFLFAWIGAEPTRALRAVRLSPQGGPVEAPRELAPGAFRHAVACTQDVCLVVTTEPGAGGAEHRLRRVDAAGLGALGGAVPLRAGVDLTPVHAAANADRFAVAAKAAGGANLLTRVAVDGTVLDAPALTIPDQQVHALVGRAGGFALATSAVLGGAGSLRLVDATIGNRLALAPEATAPVLGSLGADTVVAWRYPDSLAARRFDATGPRGVTRLVGGASARSAALAGGPAGEVVAAWTEHDATPDVAARRLRVRPICGH